MKIADNTLFWYCSDNGGLQTHSSGGRAKKGSIYEGGLRVPAIIEWPARIKQARIIEDPAVTSDIYPTLVQIVGVKVDNQPPLDGVSLVEVIDGKNSVDRDGIGFWDHPTGGVSTPTAKLMADLLEAQQNGDEVGDERWLRKDAGQIKQQYPEDSFPGHSAWLDYPWKLHRIETKSGNVKFELYNLADDPQETRDLSDSNASLPKKMRSQMQGELEAWLASVARSLNGKDY